MIIALKLGCLRRFCAPWVCRQTLQSGIFVYPEEKNAMAKGHFLDLSNDYKFIDMFEDEFLV